MIAVRIGSPITSSSWAASTVCVQVVVEAGDQCECTIAGCHGTGRCTHGGQGGHREQLVVGPRDPAVPIEAAWELSREELAAWCPRCLVRAQSQTNTRMRRWPQ